MIKLKNKIISFKGIFFLLVLLGGSSSLFSANEFTEKTILQEHSVELWSDSLGDEQINFLDDSIASFQYNLVFTNGCCYGPGRYDGLLRIHSSLSLGYITRSRSIIPGLGIRKLIFPFHVFL